ncbi:MAG: RNA pyrophosphohydrolase [Chlamydiae bacterium]|nr:RNA pyrophosphohydrolase [Chlamydiota bacterium]
MKIKKLPRFFLLTLIFPAILSASKITEVGVKNFRNSVESVIIHNNRVLLVKRSAHCKVAPNVWNVPAGKVKYLESTHDAVIRETSEETTLEVSVVKLLAETAFTIKSGDQDAYRNMFTYLVEVKYPDQVVQIDEEHSEYVWVNREELSSSEYDSMLPRLKETILDAFEYSKKKTLNEDISLKHVTHFKQSQNELKIRVAGVLKHDNQLLMCKPCGCNFFILPGGKIKLFEDSKSALKRELLEELGLEVEVGDLVTVIEDFYEFDHRMVHEIGFYYDVKLPGFTDPSLLTRQTNSNLDGEEFQWIPFEVLTKSELRPRYLLEFAIGKSSTFKNLIKK